MHPLATHFLIIYILGINLQEISTHDGVALHSRSAKSAHSRIIITLLQVQNADIGLIKSVIFFPKATKAVILHNILEAQLNT